MQILIIAVQSKFLLWNFLKLNDSLIVSSIILGFPLFLDTKESSLCELFFHVNSGLLKMTMAVGLADGCHVVGKLNWRHPEVPNRQLLTYQLLD